MMNNDTAITTLNARKIMRGFGAKNIWTNKYKTCRTVKCRGFTEDKAKEMVETLQEQGFSAKYIQRAWAPLSVIVRIPFSAA